MEVKENKEKKTNEGKKEILDQNDEEDDMSNYCY